MSARSPNATVLAAAALALALAALAAQPGALAGTPGDPLDPEKAFPAFVALAPPAAGSAYPGIDVSFQILEGYYLYRDRIRISVDGAALTLGDPRLPRGQIKDDPFIGKTETLHQFAAIHVPFKGPVPPGEYLFKVTAQGCLEEKVCYAPFTQTLKLKVP